MKNAMNFRPVGLMLLFCLIPLWAFAQSVMVKGVVKDTCLLYTSPSPRDA